MSRFRWRRVATLFFAILALVAVFALVDLLLFELVIRNTP